jgi:cytochrome c oxidase cbb3-type subunit III
MGDVTAFRSAKVCAFGLLAILSFAASAEGQSNDKKDTPGGRAYAAVCAGCHGLDGKGGERAPDIASRQRVRELSDAAILRVLQNGLPNTSMPSFRSLGDEKLQAVLTHVRELQGLRNVRAVPGDAEHGKAVFFAKGGCANCHMVTGRGGFFASDLSGFGQGHSPESIRQAIVAPNRELDPRRRVVIATLASGETLEGLARNEDNFSLQLLTQDGTLHLLSKSSLAKLAYKEESAMPADYGTKLSAPELDDLVKFLASVAELQSSKRSGEEREEE